MAGGIRQGRYPLVDDNLLKLLVRGRGLKSYCKKGIFPCDMVVCLFERRGKGRA